LAVPQIVITVVDHQSDTVRDIDLKNLGARLHKEKCLSNHISSFPVSKASQVFLSVYLTDPVVPTAYKCVFFRVTARAL